MIKIRQDILIPQQQIVFRTSRSAGPGGQNVNKLNSRVTLLFDIENTAGLTQPQKNRIHRRLKNRIDKNGILHITCQSHRSQSANKTAAVNRFVRLLQEALTVKPVRKITQMPFSAIKKRLKNKKKRSIVKQQRTLKNIPDDSIY